MLPWSVMPTAGWPSAAAVATTSPIRAAPSSIEYSVCRCRWTNELAALRQRPLPPSPSRRPQVLWTVLWRITSMSFDHTRLAKAVRPSPQTGAVNRARPPPPTPARQERARASRRRVSEPWVATSVRLLGQCRVDERRRVPGARGRRRRPAGGSTFGTSGPSQPSSRSSSRGSTQAWSTERSSRAAASELGGGALDRVEVAEATRRPSLHVDHRLERGKLDPAVAHVHLAVVRGHEQDGRSRQRIEQVSTRRSAAAAPPDRSRVNKPNCVRDRIDARVIRVDELLSPRRPVAGSARPGSTPRS